MNYQTLPFLFPCVAGVFWLLTYFLFTPKGGVFRKGTNLLVLLTVFFFLAFLSCNTGSRLLLHYVLFEQVTALLLIPVFMSYIREIKGVKTTRFMHKLIWILPFIHLLVGVETVYSTGFEKCLSIYLDLFDYRGPMFSQLTDKSQVVFYVCYTYMFKAFLLTDFLVFSVSLMSCAINGNCGLRNIAWFFFKKQKAGLVPARFFLSMLIFLVVVSALVLGKVSYMNNVWLVYAGCVLLFFLVSMLAFVGMAGNVELSSIPGILKLVRSGNTNPDAESVTAEEDVPETGNEQPVEGDETADNVQTGDDGISESNDPVDPADDDFSNVKALLDSSFEKHVKDGGLFLKHELTLQSVADDLQVSKSELSYYMDLIYGMSFQSYINMLRIDYSEQYLLSHDKVTQQEIAAACGFSSASAFNTSFRRLTGVTPKIWKDRYLEMSKKG